MIHEVNFFREGLIEFSFISLFPYEKNQHIPERERENMCTNGLS